MRIDEALQAAKDNPGKVGARPVGERKWIVVWNPPWKNFGKRHWLGRGKKRTLVDVVFPCIVFQPGEVVNERGPVEWEVVQISEA